MGYQRLQAEIELTTYQNVKSGSFSVSYLKVSYSMTFRKPGNRDYGNRNCMQYYSKIKSKK